MLLVVLDHARIGPFHGGFIGVDVFFVISGFLITGLLIGEAQRTHRISLLGFYARRAKRIIPAATVVLAVTAVASYFVLNGVAAVRLFKDSVWATFFAANIKFAQDETDYWAQDAATSPIQHYWSLAVEEQFYLVWPLVVLLLVWLFRSRGRDRRERRTRGTRAGPALPMAVQREDCRAGGGRDRGRVGGYGELPAELNLRREPFSAQKQASRGAGGEVDVSA